MIFKRLLEGTTKQWIGNVFHDSSCGIEALLRISEAEWTRHREQFSEKNQISKSSLLNFKSLLSKEFISIFGFMNIQHINKLQDIIGINETDVMELKQSIDLNLEQTYETEEEIREALGNVDIHTAGIGNNNLKLFLKSILAFLNDPEDAIPSLNRLIGEIRREMKVLGFSDVDRMETKILIAEYEKMWKISALKIQQIARVFVKRFGRDTLQKANYLPHKPYNLADFGYEFVGKEKKVKHVTGIPFQYVTELHYQALGDCILEELQKIMIEEGLEEHWVNGFDKKDPTGDVNIFLSDDFYTNEDRLMVFVQGTGAVRPGQWARALCLNESLDHGSILPLLRKAKAQNFASIVLNPNENIEDVRGEWKGKPMTYFMNKSRNVGNYRGRRVPNSSNCAEHTITVFDRFISQSPAKEICLIAHSNGGYCTMQLLRERQQVLKRLKAVAFTDACHSRSRGDSAKMWKWLATNSIDWVASHKPLDSIVPARWDDIPCRSSGHTKHEWTTYCATEPLFKFLCSKVSPLGSKKNFPTKINMTDDMVLTPSSVDSSETCSGGDDDNKDLMIEKDDESTIDSMTNDGIDSGEDNIDDMDTLPESESLSLKRSLTTGSRQVIYEMSMKQSQETKDSTNDNDNDNDESAMEVSSKLSQTSLSKDDDDDEIEPKMQTTNSNPIIIESSPEEDENEDQDLIENGKTPPKKRKKTTLEDYGFGA
eukprot:TRINITY_DN244759_c0_g1_i1.p1 TRINITY_DN244759_c0_g1~~TRINITY_DN244759_c0_g1_i1.p1  ORF type:complete len:711 (+),score=207.76 TRINITY_DN244759_c0_g1_i1:123-2255(+)